MYVWRQMFAHKDNNVTLPKTVQTQMITAMQFAQVNKKFCY